MTQEEIYWIHTSMALRIHCIHWCKMWHTIPWWSVSAQSPTRNENLQSILHPDRKCNSICYGHKISFTWRRDKKKKIHEHKKKNTHTHTQNLLQLKLKPVSQNTIHFKSCVMPMMNFINVYYKLCYDKKRKWDRRTYMYYRAATTDPMKKSMMQKQCYFLILNLHLNHEL